MNVLSVWFLLFAPFCRANNLFFHNYFEDRIYDKHISWAFQRLRLLDTYAAKSYNSKETCKGGSNFCMILQHKCLVTLTQLRKQALHAYMYQRVFPCGKNQSGLVKNNLIFLKKKWNLHIIFLFHCQIQYTVLVKSFAHLMLWIFCDPPERGGLSTPSKVYLSPPGWLEKNPHLNVRNFWPRL